MCKYTKPERIKVPDQNNIKVIESEKYFSDCLYVDSLKLPMYKIKYELKKAYGEPLIRTVTNVHGYTYSSKEIRNDEAEWMAFGKFVYFNDPHIGIMLSMKYKN